MKELVAQFRSAVAATLVLVAVCCGLYPAVVFALAQILFPDQANGSLIVDAQGVVRGSRLLGQRFTTVEYFQARPSAAGDGYDARSSGGSNLGPTSRRLHDAIQERVAAYRRENGLSDTHAVPADAVTASGSGLDPQISVRNAELQAPRVARARGLDPRKLRALIAEHTTQVDFGFLGEPGVNVLQLNLALDGL